MTPIPISGTAVLLRSAVAPVPAVMFLVASMIVMVTMNIRLKNKLSLKQRLHCLICTAGHTAVKTDLRFCQCILSPGSNASADQCIHFIFREHPCKSAVAAAACIYHLRPGYLPVFNIINLKLLRMPEMLEYISVLISYCNLHNAVVLSPVNNDMIPRC